MLNASNVKHGWGSVIIVLGSSQNKYLHVGSYTLHSKGRSLVVSLKYLKRSYIRLSITYSGKWCCLSSFKKRLSLYS